ncbi:hypothetical protein CCMSSC00406_0010228 [Pleurotus cornucopiae]|uniref:Uncharacterized protein n=1 Tax=Pleurotus cornucopiae TaxID=5321 RepID=A0ACB7JBE9_PLECO|nr:hypothetical protein CCMSSC00406_0010228 [Pleurotus cornucopiae]
MRFSRNAPLLCLAVIWWRRQSAPPIPRHHPTPHTAVALHLLRGLAFAHGRHIVHTDLKADNILFTTGSTREDIDKWVTGDPPRRNPPEMSSDGIVQSAVSQPMNLPSEEEASKATYVLSNFGSAQPSNLHANRTITTPQHRAPEVLGGEWDKPADIWAFRCLVYELVTSRALFSYRPNDIYGFSETENLLYQLALKAGKSFRAAQLKTWPNAIEYFHLDNCRLRGDPRIFDYGIEYNIGRLEIMSWNDTLPISEFIWRCLRLNPDERATATDLLDDEWFAGVE